MPTPPRALSCSSHSMAARTPPCRFPFVASGEDHHRRRHRQPGVWGPRRSGHIRTAQRAGRRQGDRRRRLPDHRRRDRCGAVRRRRSALPPGAGAAAAAGMPPGTGGIGRAARPGAAGGGAREHAASVRARRPVTLRYAATARAAVLARVLRGRRTLARVRGTARGANSLRMRAPRRPGRYRLRLDATTSDGRSAAVSALLIVRRPARGR